MNESIPKEQTKNNSYVYLDLKVGDAKFGRVIIELFDDVVPKTVENFRALCTGEIHRDNQKLHFKGTEFHRVLPQFLVQGGGGIFKDPSKECCLYGSSFDDENFILQHDVEGTVGMANKGPNTNCTQFYVTTVPCPHLDGINVAFGYVRKGMNVIREMAEVARNDKDRPLVKCLIENCGQYRSGDQMVTNENDETEDVYPPWPSDFDEFDECKIEDVVTTIKNAGNHFYNKKNFLDADRKYKKVLRYIDFINTRKRNHDCGMIKNIKLQTLVNLAAVKYHKDNYRDVIDICTQVLDIDENHGKALYRRGRARSKLKDFDKALSDLQQASLQFPNDNNIVQEMYSVKEEKQNYLLHERKIFSKMFQ